MYFYHPYKVLWGTRGVMVVVVGHGIGDPSSKPERGCLRKLWIQIFSLYGRLGSLTFVLQRVSKKESSIF